MVTSALDKKDLKVSPSIDGGIMSMVLTHLPSGAKGFGYDSYSSRRAYKEALEDLEERLRKRSK